MASPVFMPLPRPSTVRISILLSVLLIVGFTSTHQRIYTRNWSRPLEVTVFPINGDGYLSTERYIQSLDEDAFTSIDRWGEREAQRHDLDLKTPFRVSLGEQIRIEPPSLPENANAVEAIVWGLRFRYWAWKNTPTDDSGLTRVRMFVVYLTGDDRPLQHSLGMQKGLMGLVYAYSLPQQTAQNSIVIAHEMLHTVGASDKYNSYGQPLYPTGFANISRTPLLPQRNAEVMAGRIPHNEYSSHMAESLRSVVINDFTALEINWAQYDD